MAEPQTQISSRFRTYIEIISNKVPADFGVSVIAGTSMTIPGQGQDLGAIIASIVKLPPLDERTFDSPSNQEPDINRLVVKAELDSMYTPEGVNLAEDAEARRAARKAAAKEAKPEDKDPADDGIAPEA